MEGSQGTETAALRELTRANLAVLRLSVTLAFRVMENLSEEDQESLRKLVEEAIEKADKAVDAVQAANASERGSS
ncbi:hypothetical protein WCQ02_34920 [Paraburkholderia tropica]|uniref:hypothetical protein n=1 Tax=Paraburkholderia tropica TaxID=92647 RepID=UPI0011B6DC89|nr:hypothetical protein [Paraburkholderia tropica]